MTLIDAPRVALARGAAVARRMAAQTEAKGRVGGTRALQVQGALRACLLMGDTVRHWRVVNLQPSNDQKSNLLLSRARLTTDARGSDRDQSISACASLYNIEVKQSHSYNTCSPLNRAQAAVNHTAVTLLRR